MLADMYSYVDLSVMQHQSSWISTVLLAEVVNYTRIYYMYSFVDLSQGGNHIWSRSATPAKTHFAVFSLVFRLNVQM